MKRLNIVLLLAVAVAVGYLAGSWTTPPVRVIAPTLEQNSEAATSVSLMFVYDDTKLDTVTVPWQENLSLFDATKSAAEQKGLTFDSKDYGDMGVLVTAIGDKKNGTANSYWQYWVNNEQVQAAVNTYHVRPGDAISWQFRKSTF